MPHVKQDKCDVPRVSRSRRGSVWLCTCGQLWTAQYDYGMYEDGGWRWYKLAGEPLKIEGLK